MVQWLHNIEKMRALTIPIAQDLSAVSSCDRLIRDDATNPLTHPRDAEMRKPQAIENNVLEWFVSMLFSRVHLCRLNFCPERDMSRRL